MLIQYASVAVFILFGLGFVFLNLTLSSVLAPKAPSQLKEIPYECGEVPVGTPWIRFNPRYYIYALVFLIFDVEVALMFPCAVVYKKWVMAGNGKIAFVEVIAFVLTLLVGFVYTWKKGYLNWIRIPVSEPALNERFKHVA